MESMDEFVEDPAPPVLWDADPECAHEIVDGPGGGIVCTRCDGWYCL